MYGQTCNDNGLQEGQYECNPSWHGLIGLKQQVQALASRTHQLSFQQSLIHKHSVQHLGVKGILQRNADVQQRGDRQIELQQTTMLSADPSHAEFWCQNMCFVAKCD